MFEKRSSIIFLAAGIALFGMARANGDAGHGAVDAIARQPELEEKIKKTLLQTLFFNSIPTWILLGIGIYAFFTE